MNTELTQQDGFLVPKRTLTQVAFETEDDDNTALVFTFDNGFALVLSDDGQSCCEHRYLTSDDDLESLVGSQLVSISLREVTGVDDGDYGSHEQAFVVIQTTKASMTLVTHNEHNGYYGGFCLHARIRSPEGAVLACHYIKTRDWE